MNKERIKKLKSKLDKGDYSFSDEREFLENLFVGRFNYFLVVYSLFLTAGYANNFSSCKSFVFYIGFTILFACWLPLLRGFRKHDRIMKLMFNDVKDHPANIIQKILKEEGYKPKYRVSYWMGIYIPILCILSLLASGLLIEFGLIK